MVDFPTRGDNILDIFLSNRPSFVNRIECLPGISDHDMVLVDSDIIAKRNRPVKREIRLWKKANTDLLEQELDTFSSNFMNSYALETPVEYLWNYFKENLLTIFNEHVPKKMSSSRYSEPWITKTVKSLSRRKKRAYKQSKHSSKYRHLKKLAQQEKRKAYNNYVNNMFCDNFKENPKKFWSFVKSKKCESSGIAPLKQNGITHSNPKAKANILNQQFVSVFTEDDSSELPDMGPSPYIDIPDIAIQEEGVCKLMEDLNPNKAPGPDNIPTRLLKDYAKVLCQPLSLIYQASIDQGHIPDDWRKATISPIFKKGDKSLPVNYRPISLTSICCKMLEHIVHSHIMKYLNSNNILNDAQHGFRKSRSTESQLITTVNEQAKSLNSSEQRDSVLLDFSKAFDKVSHRLLVHKLAYYGIRNNILAWVKDFLRNREQTVVVDGQVSNSASVTSGVPQGSVIGPLLFLIYINDLPNYVRHTSTSLFADDSMISRTIRNKSDECLLQSDLNNLQLWEKTWKMQFNPAKCESISITNKKKPIKTSYNIHGQTLNRVSNTKYLGVTIDNKLTWNNHINNICKKANSTRAFLQRNTSMCPRHIKARCYTTYVRPTLEYASTVWDPSTAKNVSKLEAVQRRAARYVHKEYDPSVRVTPMLDALEWPTLQRRRKEAKAAMMYRIVNGLVAIPAGRHLTPTQNRTRGHSTRFLQPHTRVQAYKQSFIPSGVRIWNALPTELIEKPSLESFRNDLKLVNIVE